MTKLSILEQIIKASKMGYSALLSINGEEVGNIVDYGESTDEARVVLREYGWFNRYTQLSKDDFLEFEITNYIYVGNLFGEPKIKEGQKFKIKGAKSFSKVGEYLDTTIHGSLRLNFYDVITTFKRKELEPYFE